MDRKELEHEVWLRLDAAKKKRVSKRMVRETIKQVFRIIKEATSIGEAIRLKGFGKFEPSLEFDGAKCYIRIEFEQAPPWKKMCLLDPEAEEEEMEKYGYEPKRDDQLVKEATEHGKCPSCGKPISGQPPVCPDCGSTPFEEQDGKEKND